MSVVLGLLRGGGYSVGVVGLGEVGFRVVERILCWAVASESKLRLQA